MVRVHTDVLDTVNHVHFHLLCCELPFHKRRETMAPGTQQRSASSSSGRHDAHEEGRPRPRRVVVNGRLVEERTTPFPYGRCWLVLALVSTLMVTNPANQRYIHTIQIHLDRSIESITSLYPKQTSSSDSQQQSTYNSNQRQNASPPTHPSTSEWTRHLWHKVSQAYTRLLPEERDSYTSLLDDDSLINFGLFAVRETPSQRYLQIHGLYQKWQCRPSESPTCALLRNLLLPRNTHRPHDQVEHFLSMDMLLSRKRRKSFMAYRWLCGVCVATFLWTMLVPVHIIRNPLTHALTRGIWPSPDRPLSSFLVSLLDLAWFVVPVLQIMEEDLIPNQSSDSWFRPTSNADWNYAFAVIVLLIPWANLTLIHWNALLAANQRDRGDDSSSTRTTISFLAPGLGYSSDVWAACALGYLRATQDSDFSLLIHDYSVSVVAATWIRAGLQFTVVSERFSLAAVGLWMAADTIGFWMGTYQVQNHFVVAMVDNFVDSVSQFWDGLWGTTRQW